MGQRSQPPAWLQAGQGSEQMNSIHRPESSCLLPSRGQQSPHPALLGPLKAREEEPRQPSPGRVWVSGCPVHPDIWPESKGASGGGGLARELSPRAQAARPSGPAQMRAQGGAEGASPRNVWVDTEVKSTYASRWIKLVTNYVTSTA